MNRPIHNRRLQIYA